MNLRFKDDIDMKSVLKNFSDSKDSYILNSPFDEFIAVNKIMRAIHQHGYNGLVADWYRQGFIEVC